MIIGRHITTRLLPAFGVVVLLMSIAAAQTAPEPKRVLAIYCDNKDFRANINFDEKFQKILQAEPVHDLVYYPEYLETSRFPGEDDVAAFHDYLKRKYEGHNTDAFVAMTDPPLNFMLKYRKELFPNAPIV